MQITERNLKWLEMGKEMTRPKEHTLGDERMPKILFLHTDLYLKACPWETGKEGNRRMLSLWLLLDSTVKENNLFFFVFLYHFFPCFHA